MNCFIFNDALDDLEKKLLELLLEKIITLSLCKIFQLYLNYLQYIKLL